MSGKETAKNGVHKSIYANQIAASFRNGVAQPFIPYYARRLGASEIDLGWITSIQNLFPNALQIPWARLSDRLGRRTPFIIVGMTLAALAYLMILASDTVTLVLFAVLFQAVATSAVIPAWSALLGERVPVATRGRAFGSINLWAGIFSIVGGLVATVLVFTGAPESSTIFRLPFAAGLISGLIAAATLYFLKERKGSEKPLVEDGAGMPNGFEEERKKDFRYFIEVQVFYNFFMSMIWPILYFTTVDVLGASNVEIAILTLCSSLATVAVQGPVGKLMDRVGPVSLINFSRFALVSVPMIYGFATSIYHLYLLNILLGTSIAMINVAFAGYILDLSPSMHKGESFAIYNTAVGVVTFAGSLLGGYLASIFVGMWGLWLGLLGVYLISFVGRIAGAVMSLRIKDPRVYPEKMTGVAHHLVAQVRGVMIRLHFFKPH